MKTMWVAARKIFDRLDRLLCKGYYSRVTPNIERNGCNLYCNGPVCKRVQFRNFELVGSSHTCGQNGEGGKIIKIVDKRARVARL